MRIANRDEMKEIDYRTIHDCGISDELLMENAGFEFVNSFIEDYNLTGEEKIAVLCGGGNNGGDGFVIARHLKRRGFVTHVFLFVKKEKLGGIALQNFKRLYYFDVKVHDLSEPESFGNEIENLMKYDFFIDALLGIGFHGNPRGMLRKVIEFINRSGKSTVCVDMPSGVDANGGQVKLLSVNAQTTYTIGLLKYGLIDYPGKGWSGRIKVLDIGFPPLVIDQVCTPTFFIDSGLVESLIPEREENSHKGSYGHLAVIGGKRGYEGASLLASAAAIRCGCGLVTLYFSKNSGSGKPDEVIARYFPSDIENLPEDMDYEKLFSRNNAVVLGPGMGIFNAALDIIREILKLGKKVLIDADGLNNLSRNPDILHEGRGDVVITPHIGEMCRLSGNNKDYVKRNKREVALDFSKKYGVTVVLKDAVTVIATVEGEVYFNNGGVPSLSKGGSGDVLSGIIGSLMARGLSVKDAAVAGVFLHTECGRIASRRMHEDCVRARDLIEVLPDAFKEL